MCIGVRTVETNQTLNRFHRRSFLKASATITAMAFVGLGTLSGIAHADALTKAQRDKVESGRHFGADEKGQ